MFYMNIPSLKKLCTPAFIYFLISMVAILVLAIQNFTTSGNLYCAGVFKCEVYSVALIFFIKILYVLFWTWILQLICNAGYPMVSWFLLLLPFIALFLAIAWLIMA